MDFGARVEWLTGVVGRDKKEVETACRADPRLLLMDCDVLLRKWDIISRVVHRRKDWLEWMEGTSMRIVAQLL